MALLKAMLKGAKTINRWCLSQVQIKISWLFCSIWSLCDNWMVMMMEEKKATCRAAAGFAAGKKGNLRESSLLHIE